MAENVALKINYGCGRRVIDGFVNIDAQHNPRAPRAPELIFAMRFDDAGALIEQTPLPDGCADELQAMHVIEHVHAWEAPAVLAEWHRLLKPGGRLVLELPNLEHACRNLLAGMDDQMTMFPLYGDPAPRDPYNCHKWGYTPWAIKRAVEAAGFRKIAMTHPQTHGKRSNRDMRAEAVK